MTPAEIGLLAGGAGSLLQGASGFFGGTNKTDENVRVEPFVRESELFRRDLSRRSTQIRVNDAVKAGIHPLYALGHSANMSGAPVIAGQSPTGSTRKDAIAGMGTAMRGFGRTLERYNEAQVRQSEAAARLSEAEATKAESELAQLDQASQAVKSEVVMHQPGDPTTVGGIHAPYRQVQVGWHEDGSPMYAWFATNPDETFAEGLPAGVLTFIRNVAPSLLDRRPKSREKRKKQVIKRIEKKIPGGTELPLSP